MGEFQFQTLCYATFFKTVKVENRTAELGLLWEERQWQDIIKG